MSIKNVAITGANSNVGAPLIKALVDSGEFVVTVLARASSQTSYPESVKVVVVDLESVESLTAALKGQDAVVSTVGMAGIENQSIVIDAAIAAGVKRFLPSDFGSDYENSKTKLLPIFGQKVVIRNYLKEKAAANPDFTYTFVANGVFLDWGINVGFIFALQSEEPRIIGNGDIPVSTTTLPSVAQAIVGVLKHPSETANRSVYVEDLKITQNKILQLLHKVAPHKKYTPKYVEVDEIKKDTDEKIAKGDYSPEVMFEYLYVGVFAKGYGGAFEKLDNELLGLKGMTEKDVEKLLEKAVAGAEV